MLRSLTLLLCLGAAGLGAQAQVLRCTDAGTGRVTYTDGHCAHGSTAQEVQARRTPEEIQLENERAAQALAREQQRLQAEAAEAAANDARRAANKPKEDPSRSPECASSRRKLDAALGDSGAAPEEQGLRAAAAQKQVDLDCLGPEAYAELEKTRAPRPVALPPLVIRPPYQPVQIPAAPAPAPAPPEGKLTNCNVFRCYDKQGKRYPR
ncbi:DUF4124 domain-containing protein [Verminephrobacter aporrectodeae subsp. tuberculatae]|uniref:DUF4124 domain-containing protein n=2 Tax=Verminephrobacter TaxID=364316 RepID=A0ABT3KQB6_9BURK|nr:DUF4124 domain-containing protein [Verminephrobacter aporrectodeae]MCW5290679.1 DUF4124 domain-containing protein [Verminephrobacter aporrectodeae subsp. tuberculatae]MCW5319985.1 DUF4124 domain-containing protein [Verminephrobacter aporrectodeae subsp. tuberculatae]